MSFFPWTFNCIHYIFLLINSPEKHPYHVTMPCQTSQLNSTHAVWWTELRMWEVCGRATDSEPLLWERRSIRCPWESLVGRLPPVDLQLFSVSHGFLHKALLLSTLDFLSRTICIHVNGGVGVGWVGSASVPRGLIQRGTAAAVWLEQKRDWNCLQSEGQRWRKKALSRYVEGCKRPSPVCDNREKNAMCNRQRRASGHFEHENNSGAILRGLESGEVNIS